MITLIYLYLLGVIIYPFTMLIKRLNYILLKKTIRIIVFGIGIIIGFKFDYSYLIIEIRETRCMVIILAFLFMLSHFKNRFRYVELLDIGIFSLIISWLYYFSGNLLFVIVIHFSRNLAIELFDLLKE